jgi:hypothetical protein
MPHREPFALFDADWCRDDGWAASIPRLVQACGGSQPVRCHRLIATLAVFQLTLAFAPSFSIAGPYGDEFAKCLVRSTTDADKNFLVKWMFAAMASHPEVKSMASISVEQADVLNKGAAVLFERLLTESCLTQTRETIKYEGGSPIEGGFAILGSVAARGLMSHPDVAVFLSGMGNYIDSEKIQAALDKQ